MPVFSGILSSLIALFLPIIATLSGFELTSIGLYKIVIPLFIGIGVCSSAFILWVDEQVIVSKAHKAKVSFKKSIKTIFSNKYMWIIYGSQVFASISSFNMPLLAWVALYGTRMQWISGILAYVVSIPATPGNLLTPFFTKRMSKRKAYIMLTSIKIACMFALMLFVFINNDMGVMIYIAVILACSTLVNASGKVIQKSCVGDVWDYHQWKYGREWKVLQPILTI